MREFGPSQHHARAVLDKGAHVRALRGQAGGELRQRVHVGFASGGVDLDGLLAGLSRSDERAVHISRAGIRRRSGRPE